MSCKKVGLVLVLVLCVLISFGCANKQSEQNTDSSNSSDNAASVTPVLTQEVNGSITAAPTDAPGEEQAVITPPEASTESTTAVEPTAVPVSVKLPQSPTNYITDEMYKNAMMNEGDLARLAAVMKKARNGEEITVAVIGGSITQGTAASSPNNNYGSIFYKWWQTAFPNVKINYINDGIGATTSYLAVHRIDKDLLPKKPDVVVVEFSVNDMNTLFYKETYEDLIRRILKQDNNPAVIPLYMVQENGTSAVTQHLLVSFTYNLPRINYGQAVLKEIEKGTFTWKDISPDNIHPNDKGHAIVGEILWRYLNSVYAKLDSITEEVTPLTTQPIFTEAYSDATIFDSTNIEPVSYGSFEKTKVFDRFPNDWKTTTGKDSIVFETEAQNIGIMYYKTVDGKSGQYEVYIDGQLAMKLDANFKGGWGNYAETVEIYRSGEKKLHRIEIRKAADSTGDVFSILGLLIS